MRQGIVAGAEITTKTAEGFHFGFQSADLGISSNVPQLCQCLLSSFVDLRLPPPVRFARSLVTNIAGRPALSGCSGPNSGGTLRLIFGLVLPLLLFVPAAPQETAQKPATPPPCKCEEVMIPMRDGVHLQTVILTPVDQQGPLPILIRRTPYGVPAKAPDKISEVTKELAQDGYIFVIQNLRGRFKSEGEFKLSSWVDLKDPKATNETTDAYDSIDWLVKNVPNNNGKVGMYGVSYDGLTTALTLLQPHPALKAISEQASPVDQWMNDDDHRYGALRESYDFEYAVYEQADKQANTHFKFETYDSYAWYLDLGPLSNINAKYLHGSIPYWNSIVAHPDYDKFWKDEAWVNQVHGAFVPNLNVAGFWDQEDPW